MDLQASIPHTFRERYRGSASKLDMGRTANEGECILSNRPRAQFNNHHETAFHKETRKGESWWEFASRSQLLSQSQWSTERASTLEVPCGKMRLSDWCECEAERELKCCEVVECRMMARDTRNVPLLSGSASASHSHHAPSFSCSGCSRIFGSLLSSSSNSIRCSHPLNRPS